MSLGGVQTFQFECTDQAIVFNKYGSYITDTTQNSTQAEWIVRIINCRPILFPHHCMYSANCGIFFDAFVVIVLKEQQENESPFFFYQQVNHVKFNLNVIYLIVSAALRCVWIYIVCYEPFVVPKIKIYLGWVCGVSLVFESVDEILFTLCIFYISFGWYTPGCKVRYFWHSVLWVDLRFAKQTDS